MSYQELTDDQMRALVGTRHATTDMEYPAQGLQPYYHWLVNTLDKLAQSSVGAFRVGVDAQVATSVYVAPGRATISGTPLTYVGGTISLATYNNDTAHVWLYNNAGAAAIGVGASASGWPAGAHIKLAEVTLVAGALAQVLDRRMETIFSV